MIHRHITFFSLLLIISLSATSECLAQAPVAYFSFDDCSATEDQGNFDPGMIQNNIDCGCGVGATSNALYFDGGPDTLTLDPRLKDLFAGDFSVSFYFWTENTANAYSLLSIRNECKRDSSLFIQYLPQTDEIILEFSRNIAEGIFFREPLNSGSCWHHLLLTREGVTFALYLDGIFVGSKDFLGQILMGTDFDFNVGYSPCVGITDQFFNGRIDELMFHDYALKEEQITEILQFPDEIITMDTTIFLGDQFQIQSGSSCAPNIQWQPVTGLDNSGISTPVMSPQQTTTYTISFDHGTCISRDTIRVSVISQDDIECDNILLPKAFTPNGDGLNDVYGISNLFAIDAIRRFQIFDRWGHMLFETINKNETWDGTVNGTTLMPGVYVYQIEYTCLGEDYRKTGSFNILK